MMIAIGQELRRKNSAMLWKLISTDYNGRHTVQAISEINYPLCYFTKKDFEESFYIESEEIKMESKVVIPCNGCVHKGICKYEDMTRDYVTDFFTRAVPVDLKAKIKVFEVECELYKMEEK